MKWLCEEKPSSVILSGVHSALFYQIPLDRLFTEQEVDEFVSLYQDPGAAEADLHRFFEANPKFLYVLGAYNGAVSELSFRSTRKDVAGRDTDLRLDFLLRHQRGAWDVVELKKPYPRRQGSYIVGPAARRKFSNDVMDAVAQLTTYLDELDRDSVRQELQRAGITVSYPQGIIIIGRDAELPSNERRALERNLPRSTKLVTYDDLLDLAKARTLVVTTYHLFRPLLDDDISGIPLTSFECLARAAELVARSQPPDESVCREIIQLVIRPIQVIQSNWQLSVAHFTSDDGDDRAIAQSDYSDVETHILSLERNWGCANLGRFLRFGRQSWNMRIQFDELVMAVSEQVGRFLQQNRRDAGEQVSRF